MTWTKLAVFLTVIVVTQLLCTIVTFEAIWTFRDMNVKELLEIELTLKQIDRDLPGQH
jgi:hypothetical protein